MKKILIVDDYENLRNMYEKILSVAGYVVDVAENGVEALKILKNKNFNFDVILTDINMPVMDGFELAEKIKNKKIKIIFMTGVYLINEKIRQKKFPDCLMLKKPFEMKKLLALLEKNN